MAEGQVTVVMSARSAELMRAWERAQQGPREFAEELTKVQHMGERAGKSMEAFSAAALLGFETAAAGAEKIVETLKKAIELQIELDRERDKAAVIDEEAMAGFLNQSQLSGLSDEARKAIGERLSREGTRYGLAPKESLALGTEAASQGVAAEQIPAFVEAAEKFSAAQNKQIDVETLKAFIAQVRVQDSALSPEAAERTAKAFFGAFLGRQIQPQQLEPFSRVNYGLRSAGLSPEEQIAANVAALDLYGGSAEQAATFNRAFFGKLRSSGGRSEAVKTLGKMGMTPADVDFVDENIHDVLDRLAAGFARLKESERVPAATKLFGEEYGPNAVAFVEQRQKVTDIEADIAKGAARFEASAQRLTNTEAALQRRNIAEREAALAEHGEEFTETVSSALAATLEKQGAGGIEQYLAAGIYRTLTFLDRHMPFGGGLSREEALDAAHLAAASVSADPGEMMAAKKEIDRLAAPTEPERIGPRDIDTREKIIRFREGKSSESHATRSRETLDKLDEQTKLLRKISDQLADNRVRIENPGEPGRTANRGRARPAPIKGAGSP